jgi:hypothetical protein
MAIERAMAAATVNMAQVALELSSTNLGLTTSADRGLWTWPRLWSAYICL